MCVSTIQTRLSSWQRWTSLLPCTGCWQVAASVYHSFPPEPFPLPHRGGARPGLGLSSLSPAPGSDAIIRQHKAACLRITALLVCEELLWVGTSAGVVLTMPTSPSTVSCPRAPLSPAGLGQGHTGHVRFLAAVQLPDGFSLICPSPPPPPDTGASCVLPHPRVSDIWARTSQCPASRGLRGRKKCKKWK